MTTKLFILQSKKFLVEVETKFRSVKVIMFFGG
jgi:hypothetical protein